jgi:hypothetical protein
MQSIGNSEIKYFIPKAYSPNNKMPLGISKLKAVFTFPSPIVEPQLGS